jgi:uncharacterized protein involved in copper resistance
MTKEDIEQWTREAGGFDATPEFLKHFAELVASAERKACEKIIWNADAWIGSDAKIWIVKSIQEERGKA